MAALHYCANIYVICSSIDLNNRDVISTKGRCIINFSFSFVNRLVQHFLRHCIILNSYYYIAKHNQDNDQEEGLSVEGQRPTCQQLCRRGGPQVNKFKQVQGVWGQGGGVPKLKSLNRSRPIIWDPTHTLNRPTETTEDNTFPQLRRQAVINKAKWLVGSLSQMSPNCSTCALFITTVRMVFDTKTCSRVT